MGRPGRDQTEKFVSSYLFLVPVSGDLLSSFVRFARETYGNIPRFQLTDGFGIFRTASRFNHACEPARNVDYKFDYRRGLMVFTARKPIEEGAELAITYGGSPEDLYMRYGFSCVCGGCSGFSKEQIEALKGEYRMAGVEWLW